MHALPHPELTTGSQRAPACSPAVAAIPAGVEAPRGRTSRDRLAGARALRPLSGALAALLLLTACDADPIAARAVLEEHGLHAASLRLAAPFDRPCRFGEPYALRFIALDEAGNRVSGVLCSETEDARDARFLPEAEGSS